MLLTTRSRHGLHRLAELPQQARKARCSASSKQTRHRSELVPGTECRWLSKDRVKGMPSAGRGIRGFGLLAASAAVDEEVAEQEDAQDDEEEDEEEDDKE